MTKRTRPALLLLTLLLLTPGQGEGHGIHHEITSGEIVSVAFRHHDDTPLTQARYRIVREGETGTLASGATDANGECSFRPPGPGTYLVRVWTADGHGTTATVVLDDDAFAESPEIPDRRSWWMRVVIGLSVIAGVGLVVWLVLRRTQV